MKKIPNFIHSTPIVILSTVDENGYPCSRAMLNLMDFSQHPQMKSVCEVYGGEKTVFLTTNTSSRKIHQIKTNEKASLYFYDAETFNGVLLRGKISIVNDVDAKKAAWVEQWNEYYPDGVLSDDYALLRFEAEKVEIYGDYTVTECTL
ncbi:MAG: pyridoxamine 5'-phosphate oxidase family protein [Flavobacteriales bacterium]|nr:pyridoxamine 5'-phosphate oxidase family protein [Flavobacteriales bacterium]